MARSPLFCTPWDNFTCVLLLLNNESRLSRSRVLRLVLVICRTKIHSLLDTTEVYCGVDRLLALVFDLIIAHVVEYSSELARGMDITAILRGCGPVANLRIRRSHSSAASTASPPSSCPQHHVSTCPAHTPWHIGSAPCSCLTRIYASKTEVEGATHLSPPWPPSLTPRTSSSLRPPSVRFCLQ